MVDAVVLAGGNLGKITETQAESRSLLEIKGKSMLEYEINALRGCSFIDRIAIVAPFLFSEALWKDEVDEIVVSNESLAQNVLVGLERLATSKFVLIASSDIPLITSRVISDFLAECEKKEAQVYYPIIPRQLVEKKFPGCERTYVKLKEGAFTGGNLILVDSDVVRKNINLIEEVYEARKSPVKLVKILGLRFIAEFLVHRLSIKKLEEEISRLIDAKAVAIISKHPEIGVDVDTDSDLELVRKVLK